MRAEHIEDVLIGLHAGQWFSWSDPRNKIYENLIIDGGQDKPTKEFLESELVSMQSEYDSHDYSRSRVAEYPSTNDLIIALWEKVVEGRAETADALEVNRQAVKTKYPKP
jgi:hypothetical protein